MTDECEKTTKFELDEKSTAESHGNREQIKKFLEPAMFCHLAVLI